MCSRTSPALMCTGSMPWCRASASVAWFRWKIAASSAMTNFTAAPPAGRNSEKYSDSMTFSHRSIGTAWTSITSIARYSEANRMA